LTWKVEQGLINNNCIETYYTFQGIIHGKKDYYINKYGIIPEFKAGVNMGKVTVAEVGVPFLIARLLPLHVARILDLVILPQIIAVWR
jgi:hypothetical protein